MDGRLAALESEHFVLRFDPERDWVLAEPALEALEAGYGAIGAWLGERAPPKVRVEIAPSAEDFERVSGLAAAGDRDRRRGGRQRIQQDRACSRRGCWRAAIPGATP